MAGRAQKPARGEKPAARRRRPPALPPVPEGGVSRRSPVVKSPARHSPSAVREPEPVRRRSSVHRRGWSRLGRVRASLARAGSSTSRRQPTNRGHSRRHPTNPHRDSTTHLRHRGRPTARRQDPPPVRRSTPLRATRRVVRPMGPRAGRPTLRPSGPVPRRRPTGRCRRADRRSRCRRRRRRRRSPPRAQKRGDPPVRHHRVHRRRRSSRPKQPCRRSRQRPHHRPRPRRDRHRHQRRRRPHPRPDRHQRRPRRRTSRHRPNRPPRRPRRHRRPVRRPATTRVGAMAAVAAEASDHNAAEGAQEGVGTLRPCQDRSARTWSPSSTRPRRRRTKGRSVPWPRSDLHFRRRSASHWPAA